MYAHIVDEYTIDFVNDPTKVHHYFKGKRRIASYTLSKRVVYPTSESPTDFNARIKAKHDFQGFTVDGKAQFPLPAFFGVRSYQLVYVLECEPDEVPPQRINWQNPAWGLSI